jgi:hypothetical protein
VAEYADVPPEVLAELRSICLALPDAYELEAYAGARWLVRKKTFAWVVTRDLPAGPVTVLQFRSSGDELDVLLQTGFPFMKAGWGHDVVNLIVTDATDWDEVTELVTESYCIQAPKKLAALVDRPTEA